MDAKYFFRKIKIRIDKLNGLLWFGTVFFLLVLNTACEDDLDAPALEDNKLKITIGQKFYDELAGRLDMGTPVDSDPLIIRKAFIEEEKLHIQVTYSGGCEEHTFELLWPEHTPQIYPFQLRVYLIHDAHGDLCEAAISETLTVDLKGQDLNYDSSTIEQLEIIVINGNDSANVVTTKE